jgi:hypothetical protein
MSEFTAWSLRAKAAAEIAVESDWPAKITRDWGFGGATGGGVKVCIPDRKTASIPRRSAERSARSRW